MEQQNFIFTQKTKCAIMLTGLNLNRALLFKGSVLAESLDRSVFYEKKYLDSSQVPSSQY